MKKRLRFLMPHVPLKVLRGEQDEEDVQDKYFERLKPPPTTTDEDSDDSASDDSIDGSSEGEDGVGAQLLNNAPDIANSGDEICTRNTNRNADSAESLIQQNYNSTGSVNKEAVEMQAVAQVHFVPNIPSIDDEEESDDDHDGGNRLDEHTLL